MEPSFYTENELKKMSFKEIGVDCKISRFARFYSIENIIIGNNVRIDDFCILSGNIQIGSYVHIGAYSALFGGGGIVMEDFSGISSRVSIYSVSDNYSGDGLTGPCVPDKYRKVEQGLVKLHKHSLVGTGSVLLPNTTLLEGCTVGSMSLVKGKVPEWTIYAGVPAKYIKNRKKTEILRCEELFLKEIYNNETIG